ncbi:hypothetical protein B0H14DRAFT_261002 [Mycena olivaceomarginata]|nr:hypothetical protein B0H14DRAFT_261002 [Mycena olivaceomarginata]
MKKMLLEEYPDIELTYTKGEYAPQISGGTGGAGGGGRERGGAGGTGMAPQIGVEYLHRFSEIRGGTGGLGGAGSVEKPNVVATGVNTDPTPQRIVNIDGMIGTSEPPEVVAAGVNTGPAPQRILIGMCSFIWGWILHIEILQVDKEKPVDRVLRVALVALVGRRKSLYHMFLSSVKLLVCWSPFTLGC